MASISRMFRYQGSLATWMKCRHEDMALRLAVCLCALTPPTMHIARSLYRKNVLPFGSEIAVCGRDKETTRRWCQESPPVLRWLILEPVWSFSESCCNDNVKEIQSIWPCINNAYLNSYQCKFTFTSMFFLFFLSSFMPVYRPGQVPGLEVAQSHRREELRWVALGCKTLEKTVQRYLKSMWDSYFPNPLPP